jgi:energy-converting hydrogenase Eha subunit A
MVPVAPIRMIFMETPIRMLWDAPAISPALVPILAKGASRKNPKMVGSLHTQGA